MKFFSWLRSLLRRKHVGQVVMRTKPDEVEVTVSSGPSASGSMIALVIGHTEKKQGADNYLDESEFSFNSRITSKVQTKLSLLGIGSVRIFRPYGKSYRSQAAAVAREADKAGCTHAVCFHFNSASRGARGVEVLVAETSTRDDNKFADTFTDILNERYGFVERRDDGVFTVSSKHNGYGMINRLNEKGIIACLVEPCFADYRTSESSLIFEQEDKYVDVIVDSIGKSWR